MVAPEVFCAHSRRMSADDADRLGPKGHVFVELVREQWRAPLERPGARRAIMLASVGLGVILLAGLMSIRATLSPGVALGFIALGGLAPLARISMACAADSMTRAMCAGSAKRASSRTV